MALTVPQGSSDALSLSIVPFNCVLANQEASTRPIEYDSNWEVQVQNDQHKSNGRSAINGGGSGDYCSHYRIMALTVMLIALTTEDDQGALSLPTRRVFLSFYHN